MKNILLLAVVFMCFSTLNSQTNEADFKTASGLVMTTSYGSDNSEINDLVSFKGGDFMTVNFSGKELKGKSYHITVKDIWNGKVVSDSTVFDGNTIGIKQFETLKTLYLACVYLRNTQINSLRVKF